MAEKKKSSNSAAGGAASRQKRRGAAGISKRERSLLVVIAILIVALIASVVWGSGDAGGIFGNKTAEQVKRPSILSGNYNTPYPADFSTDELAEIYFADVGQGDCIVVRLPDGTDILVDAGSGTSTTFSATSTAAVKVNLLAYLNNIFGADKSLEYVFLSHPDSDHLNLLPRVFDSFSVGTVYYNEAGKTAAYNNFVRAVNEKAQKSIKIDEDGKTYTITENAQNPRWTLTVFAPGHGRFAHLSEAKANNAMSPIMILEYAGRRVMLTGDATEETEEWLLEAAAGFELDVDVLKVGHHGSNGSTSQPFLNATKPEFAVIQVSETNTYSHPHPLLMNRLFNAGAITYRTNRHGNIVLYVDKTGKFAFGVDNTVMPDNNRLRLPDRMILPAA